MRSRQKTPEPLDRCLSCRHCETPCPSGVDYHNLLDIGRAVVDAAVPRTFGQRLLRESLRNVVPNPGLFKGLVSSGQVFRALLPNALQAKLPRSAPPAKPLPTARHARQVLVLEGCVQPSLSPNTNAAAARVLDRLGISVTPAREAGCCGAVAYHLAAPAAGLGRARRNIDGWWPGIENGAGAIVQTASGCGAFIKEYAHLLSTDPAYADKARKVSALARDLVEVLRDEPLDTLGIHGDQRLAFHCPCTLQHAQKLGGAVESLLTKLGFNLTPVPDGHLCCGSAGTYSLTHPELSRQLRYHKLKAL